MSSRRGARKLALDILYEHDMRGVSIESVLPRYSKNPAFDFARELALGVGANLDDLDRQIGMHAQDWAMDRMAPIDRNLLRLALFEILHSDDVPPAVSINEAVELAKTYSTKDSARFINGILGKVAEEIHDDLNPTTQP